MARVAVALLPRRKEERPRRSGWSVGVPLITLAAGLLFTTTATTAGGTSLREDRRPELAQLIEDRRDRVTASQERAAGLRDQVEQQTAALGGSDSRVAAQRQRAEASQEAAGFTALTGPGITVELDDAPGALMAGNLLGAEYTEAKVGRRVEVVFQNLNDEITLPQFRLAPENR